MDAFIAEIIEQQSLFLLGGGVCCPMLFCNKTIRNNSGLEMVITTGLGHVAVFM